MGFCWWRIQYRLLPIMSLIAKHEDRTASSSSDFADFFGIWIFYLDLDIFIWIWLFYFIWIWIVYLDLDDFIWIWMNPFEFGRNPVFVAKLLSNEAVSFLAPCFCACFYGANCKFWSIRRRRMHSSVMRRRLRVKNTR